MNITLYQMKPIEDVYWPNRWPPLEWSNTPLQIVQVFSFLMVLITKSQVGSGPLAFNQNIKSYQLYVLFKMLQCVAELGSEVY